MKLGIKVFFLCGALLSGIFGLNACSKNNDLNSEDESNNTKSSLKADSIATYSGNKRLEVTWVVPSSVTKAVVYYDADSAIVNANESSSRMSVILDDLKEGTENLILYLYDNEEERSSGQRFSGEVYGDQYAASLQNVGVGAAVNLKDQLFIKWTNERALSIGIEVNYTSESGSKERKYIQTEEGNTILDDYEPGSEIKYRALYQPTTSAIDTFYSSYSSFSDIKTAQTKVLKDLLLNAPDLVNSVHQDTTFKLADGVEETELYYLNKSNQPIHAFVVEMDMANSNIRLEPALEKEDDSFIVHTVRDYASNYDPAKGNVVAAVNAGFFTLATGYPVGVVVKDGVNYGGGPWRSFFGIMSNGRPYIGGTDDYNGSSSLVKDAIEGSFLLEVKGQLQSINDASLAPRTGAGINTVSDKVYLIVVDGRIPGYSVGMSQEELGKILKACGATDALNYDGGGSSTLVVKNKETSEFEVRNRPSDGFERKVSTAWLIVSD